MSKASLIVGNSNWAIKDSSLLGYNINDSNIYSPFPFDVTRASAATTVNKAGLIVTDEEILSGELITNGDFSDGSTGWTLGTGWSIGEDKAVADILGYVDLRQGGVFEVGKKYKVLVQTLQSNSGVLRLYNGSTLIGEITSVNSYVFYITATSDLLSASSSSAGFNGSISNFSVVEVNRNNLARIDYLDSTKGVLLTEPQSTNLVTESQDFNDSSWDKDSGIIVSSSNNVSPSGLKDATEISVSNNGRIYINLSSANYTGSIFIKKGTFAYFKFLGVNIDLIAKTTSNANANLTEMSNGWFRIAYNIGSSSRPIQVQAYPDNTYSAHSDSGNYYIWGAQAEILPYATSIIPTSGSTVTRNQDQVTNGGEVSTFNSEEGTLFAEIAALSDDGTNRNITISGGNSNYVRIYYSTTSSQITYLVVSNGSVAASVVANGVNQEDIRKIAVTWKLNEFKFYNNGFLLGTDTSGDTPIGLNVLKFSEPNGNNKFFGKTKQVQVFKKVLTDAELIKLTTI
jgi:hypothetical protein